VVDSLRRLELAVMSLIGAPLLASLYSLREWQTAGFSAYRPGWVAGDANYFAAVALIGIALSYNLVPVARTRRQKQFYLVALAITFLAFVISASRGGFVGLCALFLLILVRGKQKLRLLIISTLMVPLLLFAPMSPIKRIIAPEYGDTAS